MSVRRTGRKVGEMRNVRSGIVVLSMRELAMARPARLFPWKGPLLRAS